MRNGIRKTSGSEKGGQGRERGRKAVETYKGSVPAVSHEQQLSLFSQQVSLRQHAVEASPLGVGALQGHGHLVHHLHHLSSRETRADRRLFVPLWSHL